MRVACQEKGGESDGESGAERARVCQRLCRARPAMPQTVERSGPESAAARRGRDPAAPSATRPRGDGVAAQSAPRMATGVARQIAVAQLPAEDAGRASRRTVVKGAGR